MFLIVLFQSLIRFLPFFRGRTHDCLIGESMLNCVLTFYSSEYLFLLFFSLLVDPVLLPLRNPSNESWGKFIIIIRVRSTWRCQQSSVIFRSSMALSISTGDRLGWTPSWPRAGWRKHYPKGKKSFQDMKELDEKALTLISFAWRMECWISFLQSK